MIIKLTEKEIKNLLEMQETDFPKYVSPLINLAIDLHREQGPMLLVN